MRSYTEAMRTNRHTAHTAHTARHARRAPRPALAAMFVAATAAAAVTILVTAVVVALACYLAGVSSARSGSGRGDGRQAPTASTAPLIDPSAGRGAASPTCEHASRSPRCRLEGGQGLSLPRKGDGRALQPATDDGQTALLQEDVTRPAPMPGRVPGRGGWVSEEGPSRT